MNQTIMNIIFITLVILGLLFFIKREKFTPIENDKKYQNLSSEGACLMTRKITPDGGDYYFEIIKDAINVNHRYTVKPTTNQKIRYFNDEFTPEMCNKDNLGSGRKTGFECIDYMTEKEAKKVGMTFSKKTCFDALEYQATLPIYQHIA